MVVMPIHSFVPAPSRLPFLREVPDWLSIVQDPNVPVFTKRLPRFVRVRPRAADLIYVGSDTVPLAMRCPTVALGCVS